MAHKEYGVTDILDLLRRAKAKDSLRHIARATGMDRKTVRNYLRMAAGHGFDETAPDDQLPEIAAAVFRFVHGEPTKPSVPGACAPLLPHRERLSGWLETDGLTLTKAHIKLGRLGVEVTYSTLYRYVREHDRGQSSTFHRFKPSREAVLVNCVDLRPFCFPFLVNAFRGRLYIPDRGMARSFWGVPSLRNSFHLHNPCPDHSPLTSRNP